MTRRNLRVWTVEVGLCTLLTASAVAGITADNLYHPIIDRNVFGLRPPPPPPAPPESVKPPPPRLFLTGITTIFGNRKLALLKGNFSSKPGEAAKEQSFILGEGERDGDIEIVKIDEKAEIVTVNDFGVVTNLTFEKDVPKTASTTPAIPTLAPGAKPSFGMPVPANFPRQIPMPLRPIRTTSGLNPGQEAEAGGAGLPAGQAYAGASAPPVPSAPTQSIDEQEVLVEAQRQVMKENNDITHMIMPPTSLSDAADAEQNPQAPQVPNPQMQPGPQRPQYQRPPGLPPF